jgi:hypothetical protein
LVQAAIAFTSEHTQTNITVIASDYGCDTFTFRWSGVLAPGGSPIAGIDFVFVQKGSYLIEKAYSELNNVLFLSENGCKTVGGICGTNNCDVCKKEAKARDTLM